MESLASKFEAYKNKKKKVQPKKAPAQQFQEICLGLLEIIDVPQQESMAFWGFVKQKVNAGFWWKIKEVSEQMQKKGNRSPHYFMAALSKRNVFKDRSKENSWGNPKPVEQRPGKGSTEPFASQPDGTRSVRSKLPKRKNEPGIKRKADKNEPVGDQDATSN